MNIASVLGNAILGPNAAVRSAAEQELQNAVQADFPQYLAMLQQVLADQSQRTEILMMAGIAIKNQITSKDYRIHAAQAERWLGVDPALRQSIKDTALNILDSTSDRVGSTGAQLVAAIAEVELPVKQWPGLTQVLVDKTGREQPDNVKRASLLAIGYVCETADPTNQGVLEQADGFLTAIVQGAQSSQSDGIRLTALNALVLSLEFIRLNFAVDQERDFIMQVVCEATQSANGEVQAAAFGALGRIACLYYQYMKPYMEKALFGLTMTGMQQQDENVACMAVEFWSTVCEEESEIKNDQIHYAEFSRPCYEFAAKASEQVVPSLLKLLTRQSEDVDEDEWNVAMAAGACLQLFAQNVKDAMVQQVLGFVVENISSTHWANREAGVMAFGSILEGPNHEELATLIKSALPSILNLMNDQSFQVKDTTAWCLGRMVECVGDAIDETSQLAPLIEGLIKGLRDHPKVVANCSWALINLSEQYSHYSPDNSTSPMSRYYQPIIEALTQTTARSDNEHSCRTSAYEALSALVKDSAQDTLQLILQLSPEVLSRLQQSMALQSQLVNSDDRVNLEELQSNLLGLLTCIIRKVDDQVAQAADNLMEMFFTLLQNRLSNSLIEEDVFIAIGAVAGAINGAFAKYMDALMPAILNGLKDEAHPCNGILVGMFADISNGLGPLVGPYCKPVMEIFFAALQDDSVPQDVKPTIISCIGDIASALGPDFSPYLEQTATILLGAASLQAGPETTLEFQDYVYGLREAIIDAYVGIVAGLRDAPAVLMPIVSSIFLFLQQIAMDAVLQSESNLKSVIGLLGDLADIFPPGQLKAPFEQAWVTEIIKNGRRAICSTATRETARWARERQKRQLQG